MPAFFDYLRNITYYLMFAAVVGMLAPAGKYKKFVSLVMGFILLYLMIAPLSRFSPAAPITDWFPGPVFNAAQAEDPHRSYAHWRNTYLRGAFETQLTAQLENLLSQNGFVVYESRVAFLDDFTALTTVHVILSRAESPQRVPFIRIQPVQIGEAQPPEACATSIAAQNLISQFYNLPAQHIYVTVR